MAGKYWDRAWTLVEGCTPVSPGCANCWAAALEWRWYDRGLMDNFGQFNGRVIYREDRLDFPLHVKTPTTFAVWNDLFHQAVPDDFIRRAFITMDSPDLTRHRFLILTKRPARMARLLGRIGPGRRNVWVGATACTQLELAEAAEGLARLAEGYWPTYLSIEPMLGPMRLTLPFRPGVVLLGGETGAGARRMEESWARDVMDDCDLAGIPFFFKSWGTAKDGPRGRVLAGREHNALPWSKTLSQSNGRLQ